MVLLFICGCASAPQETATTTAHFESPIETTSQWPEPDKLVALTFDDGPSKTTMAEILDILAEYDAKATFFIIGNKINSATLPILQRAVDEGHELGNHGMNHLEMAELTDDEIRSEYFDCQDAVKQAVGVEMYYFRAPFGSVDDRMFQIIQTPFINSGAKAADGTIGSIAADRAWRVTSGAYDGCIIGMHCFQGNSETVEALKTILPELKAQGYRFVTVSELFTECGYEIPVATPGIRFTDNKPLE